MTHFLPFEEWIDHLDGALPLDRQREVERHLALCPECRAFQHGLVEATGRLRELGQSLSSTHALSGVEVEEARRRVLARVRAEPGYILEGAAEGAVSASRLRRLHQLLAPLCGTRAAEQVLLAARSRAAAQSVSPRSAPGWVAFGEQVTKLVGALCGATSARLVGSLLRQMPEMG